MPDQVSSEVW